MVGVDVKIRVLCVGSEVGTLEGRVLGGIVGFLVVGYIVGAFVGINTVGSLVGLHDG